MRDGRFVAAHRGGPLALRREKLLEVSVNGEPRDVALVDVAASYQRFVGARAVWNAGDISELVVAFASPSAVGLSSIAGLVDPVGRHARGCGEGKGHHQGRLGEFDQGAGFRRGRHLARRRHKGYKPLVSESAIRRIFAQVMDALREVHRHQH